VSPYLTTRAAALYVGFKTPASLRKAHLERRVFPVGRRGGTGTCMWSVDDLDRFLRGEPPLPYEGVRRGRGAHGREEEVHARGMRRTFNDLARLANVEAVVTKSISGHKTERMREHYSSVQPSEQRESIGRLLRLVKPAGTVSKHRDKGCSEGCSDSPSGRGERAAIRRGRAVSSVHSP
jgi:hypothetical protein